MERKKRGDLGGKKSSKKSSRKAREVTFKHMASGHRMAKHKYDDGMEPSEEDHLLEGSADDHLDQHLAPAPQMEESQMQAQTPNVGGPHMMGGM